MIYLVCRYVLSPKTQVNEKEISSDFLHSIPQHIDREWNLTNMISLCAQTESTIERLDVYERLLKVLTKIM